MARESVTKQIIKVAFIVQLGRISPKVYPDKLAAFETYLKDNSTTYGLILHDRDCNDDGTQKTPHFHAVCRLRKKKRISTIMTDIEKALGVERTAITVETASSFEGSFQYLIHKNDPKKYQYDVSLIRTNLPPEEVDITLDLSTSSVDFQKVVYLCRCCPSLLEVIEQLGLGTYQHFRTAVQDIWRLVHTEQGEWHLTDF